jgi:hypothetical protein
MRLLYQPKILLEKDEQALFVAYLQTMRHDPWVIAIPNGAHLAGSAGRRAAQMAQLKKQGLAPGAFDLFLAIPVGKYHGAFFEMKRSKGGKVSADQVVFAGNMTIKNYYADVCPGFERARESYLNYMTGGAPLWDKA